MYLLTKCINDFFIELQKEFPFMYLNKHVRNSCKHNYTLRDNDELAISNLHYNSLPIEIKNANMTNKFICLLNMWIDQKQDSNLKHCRL